MKKVSFRIKTLSRVHNVFIHSFVIDVALQNETLQYNNTTMKPNKVTSMIVPEILMAIFD